MRLKVIFMALIAAIMFSCALIADTSTIAVQEQALTPAASVTPSPSPYPGPPHYTQAIGIDVGLANKAIPGISYSRIITKNTRASIFLGGIYTSDGFVGLAELNAYYNLNEFFYVGLGMSAALDDDNTFLLGFFNPSVGLKSDIITDYKLFIEATLVFFTYQSQPDEDAGPNAFSPFLIYKTGVRYFF